MQICEKCHTEYDKEKKSLVSMHLAKNHMELSLRHENICLSCIQEELNQEKQSHKTSLNQATINLRQAYKAYQEASLIHTKLLNKHHALDRQEAHINFFSKKVSTPAAPKQPGKKKKQKSGKSISKQTALINSLLKQLSPEKQAALADMIKNM